MKAALAPGRPRTLADLYADRDLTQAQARRIVALLGLATPRRTDLRGEDRAA